VPSLEVRVDFKEKTKSGPLISAKEGRGDPSKPNKTGGGQKVGGEGEGESIQGRGLNQFEF